MGCGQPAMNCPESGCLGDVQADTSGEGSLPADVTPEDASSPDVSVEDTVRVDVGLPDTVTGPDVRMDVLTDSRDGGATDTGPDIPRICPGSCRTQADCASICPLIPTPAAFCCLASTCVFVSDGRCGGSTDSGADTSLPDITLPDVPAVDIVDVRADVSPPIDVVDVRTDTPVDVRTDTGACMFPADCNDGNPVTYDYCFFGTCRYTSCDDNELCTTDVARPDGTCSNTPLPDGTGCRVVSGSVWRCSMGRCPPCGALDQPCCPTAPFCNSRLFCRSSGGFPRCVP